MRRRFDAATADTPVSVTTRHCPYRCVAIVSCEGNAVHDAQPPPAQSTQYWATQVLAVTSGASRAAPCRESAPLQSER
eukprot:6947485-Pyramimonas_sp.AAC.1